MIKALHKQPPFGFDVSVAITEQEKKQRKTGLEVMNVASSSRSAQVSSALLLPSFISAVSLKLLITKKLHY